jgi:hypothetical protein
VIIPYIIEGLKAYIQNMLLVKEEFLYKLLYLSPESNWIYCWATHLNNTEQL